MNKNTVVALLLLYTNTISFVAWLFLTVVLGVQDSLSSILAIQVLLGIAVLSPVAAIQLLRSKNQKHS